MLFHDGPENDGYLPILLPDGNTTIMAHRLNTTLYTFFGGLSMYNHVFIEYEAPDDQPVDESEPDGYRVFSDNPDYPALCGLITRCSFPQVLNLLQVYDTDQEAYELAHLDVSGNNDDEIEVGDWDGAFQALLGQEGPSDT